MAVIFNGVILFFAIIFFSRVIGTSARKQVTKKAVGELNTDFKPNPANNKRPPTGGTRTTGIPEGLRGGTVGSAGGSRGDLSVRVTMEDRRHDWLARQLAEEQIAKKKMRDMFGFKDVHPEHCDARAIRNEHTANCDAHGVDTATK